MGNQSDRQKPVSVDPGPAGRCPVRACRRHAADAHRLTVLAHSLVKAIWRSGPEPGDARFVGGVVPDLVPSEQLDQLRRRCQPERLNLGFDLITRDPRPEALAQGRANAVVLFDERLE